MVEAALPVPFQDLAKDFFTRRQDRTSFEYQFRTRRLIRLENGGTLAYVDLVPPKLKSDVPVYMARGWTEEIDSSPEDLKTLFDQGRRVIAVTHTRRGREKYLPKDYHKAEERKAYAHQAVWEDALEPDEQIDIVPHSEGGINATIAALRDPKRVRNIVFCAPAGITQHETFLGLVKKGTRHFIQNRREMFRSPTDAVQIVRSEQATIFHVAKNPHMAVDEINAIAHTHHLLNNLRELHDMGKGIVIVHGIKDHFFPMEEVQQNVIFAGGKKEKETKQEGFIDGFYSIDSTHNFHVRPNLTMGIVGHALDSLAALSQKKKAQIIPSQPTEFTLAI